MSILFHAQFIHDGEFQPNDILEPAATVTLAELPLIGRRLRPLRAGSAPAVA